MPTAAVINTADGTLEFVDRGGVTYSLLSFTRNSRGSQMTGEAPARNLLSPVPFVGPLPPGVNAIKAEFDLETAWKDAVQRSPELRAFLHYHSGAVVAKALSGAGTTTLTAGLAPREHRTWHMKIEAPSGETIDLTIRRDEGIVEPDYFVRVDPSTRDGSFPETFEPFTAMADLNEFVQAVTQKVGPPNGQPMFEVSTVNAGGAPTFTYIMGISSSTTAQGTVLGEYIDFDAGAGRLRQAQVDVETAKIFLNAN